MFMVMPILGSKLVNTKARLSIAVLTTILVVPLLPPLPSMTALTYQGMILVAREALIGVLTGFSFQIVFQVFVLTGQILSMKMGLGFAQMNDPSSGLQTTALSQFYLMLTTLIFVSTDGHLLMLMLLVESFQTLPPGQMTFDVAIFMKVVSLASWMFATALRLSLPVITSLLLINIAFGVMSRAAPQLNIFAVGFPFTLMCGLVLMWIGLGNFNYAYLDVTEHGFMFLRNILELK